MALVCKSSIASRFAQRNVARAKSASAGRVRMVCRAEKEVEKKPQNAIELAEAVSPKVRDAVEPTIKPRVEFLEQKSQQGVNSTQEAMTFSGPAPEIINGRLAMLGFTVAMVRELTQGVNVFEQFQHSSALVWGVVLVTWVATLVPLFRGNSQVANGSFKFRNELITGRAAMIGFAILVGYEALTHNTIFPHVF